MEESCCTCATFLKDVQPIYDEKTENPAALDRRLDCCSRVICGNCQLENNRFAAYCSSSSNSNFSSHWPFQGPYCQVSTFPSSLTQGLRDPPSYTPPSSSKPSPPPQYLSSHLDSNELPPYSSLVGQQTPPPEKTPESQPAEDVLHFLDHKRDTLASLSFRYGVPITALRRSNHITSDHLLLARRTVIIPGEFYKGSVSLSPRPVEGEDEERRRAIVRRWMVACKVSEYVLPLYIDSRRLGKKRG